ncbi:alanine--tRNA ligase [Salinisphaera orenii]|uniref:Alanine--tRNA ligase n=1 Tax=Salinisphaera orenii YIM 95161 TaxID=1051139 RepID=A0A423Q8T9_9GAMM|nr:alanine--tRNA ligase [Salinisphaera halophila]ROO36722.1 alanyl-tRNA synthetase [Salinisphaera halophila YIM 95161]
MMTTNALRARFIEYFQNNAHRFVASSSLVPASDPTLLFTNAGMVPFKDVFLGRETRDYARAVSSQRCVRAGGKHNDLENVGYTARHHTFFEMLGNFSFGDYFKREAIHFAWEFLTGELGLPAERLWVTIYEEDEEAADIWLNDIGVSADRFSRIGAKDNFWQMGDTGPCGPCSEIFYDHGPDVPGGPPGTPEEDGDRFVEIWNLVFMQYDRQADDELKPLPSPSIDTGMGLERVAAVLQGTYDNYGIDVFQTLIGAAADAVRVDAATGDERLASLKVVADHIRATAFLITDGVMPSNEGRGYVLRRIMRRAIRHGHKLGATDAFFYKLVAPLVELMGEAFPELADSRAQIERVIEQEEQRFAITLAQGMRILEDAIESLEGDEIPGETVFKLYDTYGFPVDLTNDVARERGLTLDTRGFDAEMQAQRERARAASQFGADYTARVDLSQATEFLGYTDTEASARVVALVQNEAPVDALTAGDEGVLVLDRTPFYGESGGQVGDTGVIAGEGLRFEVSDTRRQDGVFLHFGRVAEGTFEAGAAVAARVDAARRHATELNHTATHLLHAALRETLGSHVRQKGSLVAPERLRFDFAHYEPVSAEVLADIEAQVNARVRENIGGEFYLRRYDDAIAEGALAFFGEKYGEEVRVVRFGDYSVELCGGTHAPASGALGLVKLTDERGVAAGVRRVEAVTGVEALARVQELAAREQRVSARLKAAPAELEDKLDRTLERMAALERELDAANQKLAASQGDDLADSAREIGGTRVVVRRMDGADRKVLRDTVDSLKNRLDNAVVVLGAADGGKVALIAGVSKSQSGALPAGDLVNFVAEQVGGKGGGRPDMAQAGGSQPERLDDALASVYDWVERALAT